MTQATLFEHATPSGIWRLEVATHGGRTFANWRKWWHDGEVIRPTRQGVTFPLERIGELHAALGAYLAGTAPGGRPGAS